MTINYVQEMWSRQTSSEESADGKTFRVTYASAYQVDHSADETLDNIRRATGIPRVGDGYAALIYVRCTKVGDVQRVGPCYSIVPVQWQGERSRETDDPLAKEPEIEYTSISQEAEADCDGRGLPYTNVNGEPVFGIKRTINDMVLSVKRNYAAINGALALQYLDSVNIDPFLVLTDVWQPGQASMTKFKIKPEKAANNFQYYSVSCEITLRQPYNCLPYQAWWSRYRNEGLYERVGTTVEFSGGGGSGARGYAVTSSAGAITAIVVTDQGQDYSSAPSVTITGPAGSSGASATAVLDGDFVDYVTVGAGGSGYRSKLVHAVDQDGKPMTKAVLLKANGAREYNAQSAVWLLRPSKQYQLSYNALGLL